MTATPQPEKKLRGNGLTANRPKRTAQNVFTKSATRKEIIDIAANRRDGNVADGTQVIEEFFVSTEGNKRRQARPMGQKFDSREFSDYVLLGKNGRPLAVLEAKKGSTNEEIGREQAKKYCQSIQAENGGDLPFCFYTDGHKIFFGNLGEAPPQRVTGFPTRQDLERLFFIPKHKKPLAEKSIHTGIAGRDFQLQAIRSVMEGTGEKRWRFLLVMASGTGKTRTCIALIDALMHAGHVQRILFLVDRIALRERVLDAFKEHIPDEPRWPEPGEKSITTDGPIDVATYPTMLNVVHDETNVLSPHPFDLIVIDESHRSIYNTHREILDYFNAIHLGLTATPRDVVDHNTFALFQCEEGLPTFAYSYAETINHVPPYLCDFHVLRQKTKFHDEGISKRAVSLEDQKRLVLEGKEIEDINFEGSNLEKKVTNHATNALIVKEFIEESIKDPNGFLPGKAIFFCIIPVCPTVKSGLSKNHARRSEAIFDSLYLEYKGELAKVMVSNDPGVYGKGGLPVFSPSCLKQRLSTGLQFRLSGTATWCSPFASSIPAAFRFSSSSLVLLSKVRV